MAVTVSFFLFILGAAFASFLNVMAGGGGSLRENLKRDRSICESCREELRWWELIPVVSWIALRGRCDRCGARIPVVLFLSEVVLGSAFAVSYLGVGQNISFLAALLLLIIVLYFFSVYDIFHGKVPNRYIYPTLAVMGLARIVMAVVGQNFAGLVEYAIGAASFFLFFAVMNFVTLRGLLPGVSKGKQGFGWGDAKYGAFLGLVLGWPLSFVGLWIGIFAGGVGAMVIVIISKGKTKSLPFIPFMSFGVWVALMWGDAIMELARSYLML